MRGKLSCIGVWTILNRRRGLVAYNFCDVALPFFTRRYVFLKHLNSGQTARRRNSGAYHRIKAADASSSFSALLRICDAFVADVKNPG